MKDGEERAAVFSAAEADRDRSGSCLAGQEVSERLLECSEGLRYCCKRVEPDFLKLGEALQSIYDDASGLTQKTRNAVNGADGQSHEAILHKILSASTSSVKKLQVDRLQMTDNLQAFEGIIKNLNDLAGMSAVLKRIAKMLTIIGMNINIESSRMDDKTDISAEFGSEIKGVAETVRGLFKAMRGRAEETRSALSVFRNDMLDSLEQLEHLSLKAEKSVDSVAPEVEKIIRLSMNIFEGTGKQAEKISREVGKIVVGIQIHDNVSQRIEHIFKSLNESRTLCADGSDGKNRDLLHKHYSAACSSLKVQAAQLLNLITEVDKIFRVSSEAFDKLNSTVEEVSSNLSVLCSDNMKIGNVSVQKQETPMDSLNITLEKVQTLLEQGEERLCRIHSAGNQSKQSANRLSEYLNQIRDINFDIHLKALNATASAMRLGSEGKAFFVIVNELKEAAGQSNILASEVEETLANIHKTAQVIRTGAAEESDKPTKEARGRPFDIFMKEFSGVCQAVEENSGVIFEASRALNLKIITVKDGLEFLKSFSQGLSQQHRKLTEILEMLSPWDNGRSNGRGSNVDKIYSRYTMQQERRIHETVLGNGNDDALDDAEASDGNHQGMFEGFPESETVRSDNTHEEQDLLGDNVELF
jgi:hypothetical protein